jgi:hypothetical protein
MHQCIGDESNKKTAKMSNRLRDDSAVELNHVDLLVK